MDVISYVLAQKAISLVEALPYGYNALGTKNTYDELPSTGNKVGDMYTVASDDADHKAGKYAWGQLADGELGWYRIDGNSSYVTKKEFDDKINEKEDTSKIKIEKFFESRLDYNNTYLNSIVDSKYKEYAWYLDIVKLDHSFYGDNLWIPYSIDKLALILEVTDNTLTAYVPEVGNFYKYYWDEFDEEKEITLKTQSLLALLKAQGTTDYQDLDNKPKINNITLNGNKTLNDLGLSVSEEGISTDSVNYITIDNVEYKLPEGYDANKVKNLLSSGIDNLKVLDEADIGNIKLSGNSLQIDNAKAIDVLQNEQGELLGFSFGDKEKIVYINGNTTNPKYVINKDGDTVIKDLALCDDIPEIENTSGQSTDKVMSQKSVTDLSSSIKFAIAEDDEECLILSNNWNN